MGRNLGKPLGITLRRMCQVAGVPEDLNALARAIGVPYGTVKNWHNRDSVPGDALAKFAKGKGVSLEWLMGDETNQPDSKNFSQGGLQVTPAGRVPPIARDRRPPYEAPKDTSAHLLKAVVQEVLDALDTHGLTLPNERIAQFVELIYEYELSNMARVGEPSVRHTTERFLKLVAG